MATASPAETTTRVGIFSQSLRLKPSNGVSRSFENCINQIVVPGMILSMPTTEASKTWLFGAGLAQVPRGNQRGDSSSINALVRKLGILRHNPPRQEVKAAEVKAAPPFNLAWVESLPLASFGASVSLCGVPQAFHTSQFAVGDRVLGVVKKKTGDLYHLDIGCQSTASLNCLSFEGASKKNRPVIRLRDVIYAAISQADPDLEIELTCVDVTGKASGMGILGRHEPGSVGNAGGMAGGVMLTCSLQLVRRLSGAADFPLLEKLSQKFPFEICVGCNGRIWLTARGPRETMLLANTIALADYIAPEACLEFAAELC